MTNCVAFDKISRELDGNEHYICELCGEDLKSNEVSECNGKIVCKECKEDLNGNQQN